VFTVVCFMRSHERKKENMSQSSAVRRSYKLLFFAEGPNSKTRVTLDFYKALRAVSVCLRVSKGAALCSAKKKNRWLSVSLAALLLPLFLVLSFSLSPIFAKHRHPQKQNKIKSADGERSNSIDYAGPPTKPQRKWGTNKQNKNLLTHFSW
jgi:hypothetical protein